MLRILHTADWHLGHTLRGYPRDFEHTAVLEDIIRIVQEREIDTLLVAGDIFDSQHPSGESQALFYRTLARLHTARPSMNSVIIAGNHDAAGRLEAPHPLLEAFNVRIIGNVHRIDGRIDASKHILNLKHASGDPYLHVLALSYPTAACLPPIASAEIEEEESNVIRSVRALYAELHDALISRRDGLPFVVMGHLHARGGTESEGAERRILIGGQHAVPTDIFPDDAVYVALGHLHKSQYVGSSEKVRYSGSLIPLSSTEQPYRHGVTLLTIDGAETRTEDIEITRPVEFLTIGRDGSGVRLSELGDHLRKLSIDRDIDPHLRPYVHIRLSREGLGSGFREQVDKIASEFAVRVVEARPEPVPETVNLNPMIPSASHSLTQMQPEEMFRCAFQRVCGSEPTSAHLEVFHQAYARAQE